ncbi:GAF domain-containing protein [Tissierella pigra]|uniref:GAF domain-containing protein n=1 Tax=Tissierella pigra TaxID=2607614 RepID=A0A6N7XWI8_9FIRM|nr:GAF domain-containing protein [Tissierella pigra]MBU5426352.1 GAF domain-containing protein [Tissierella pigra]MSU02177.1 GAF domain-containing protein [Tissierella pigra]
MFKLDGIKDMNQEERMRYMILLVKGQLSSEQDDLANISNITGIIMACADRLNWAGFYILRDNELVLGPFQGLPACNRISMGKGVCGKAVETRETQLVPDVHLFPGHIACDSQSNSELVIPIIKNNRVYGVLDLDSPEKNRFTELEEKYFTNLVELLNQNINWEKI